MSRRNAEVNERKEASCRGRDDIHGEGKRGSRKSGYWLICCVVCRDGMLSDKEERRRMGKRPRVIKPLKTLLILLPTFSLNVVASLKQRLKKTWMPLQIYLDVCTP